MTAVAITDREFRQFQKLIYDIAGITLSDAKKPLVSGRLAKRLVFHNAGSYSDYFHLLKENHEPGELQIAVDLLTTNETYFFREPKHFDFIREQVLLGCSPRRPFRGWSAACSSGEEAYTLAMVMADALGEGAWEIVASDISSRILNKARSGHYSMEQSGEINESCLRRYCLKGIGSQEGTFLIDRALRQRIQFRHINLNEPFPDVGEFDLIFLRNVMIYFNRETKRQVLNRILPVLRPGGYLIVSHSESLHGLTDAVVLVKPSIYRKAHG